jgi:hypothetical protein
LKRIEFILIALTLAFSVVVPNIASGKQEKLEYLVQFESNIKHGFP